ncbi:MAG: phage major capsid protein [Acidobacteriota bacterium]
MAVPVKTQQDKDRTLSDVNKATSSHVADRIEAAIEDKLRAGAYDGPSQVPGFMAKLFASSGTGPIPSDDASMRVARCAVAALAANGDPKEAADFAAKAYGDGGDIHQALSSSMGPMISRAAEGGGSVVEAGVSDTWIDILTPRVAVLRLGPTMVPMPEGSHLIHELTNDVSAQYVGETEPAAASRPSMGQRRLTAKELVINVPISQALVRRAAAGARGDLRQVERFVQRLMIRRAGLKKDMAFLRATGTQSTPRGLRWWCLDENVIPADPLAQDGKDFIRVLGDLGRLVDTLEDADVAMVKPGWTMSPRIKNYLAYRCLSDDRPFFLEMISRGDLLGFAYAATSQVPSNLGPQGDATEIQLTDYDQVLVGEEMGLKLEVVHNGTYMQNGVLVSTTATREVLLVLTEAHDLGMEHLEATAVLKDVRWAA